MSKKAIGWYAISIHAILAIFCLLVLFLARENRQLKTLLYEASMAAAAGPEVDTQLPALAVRDLDGAESTLGFDAQDGDSVILVFTTSCPACLKNVDPWRDLYDQFHDRYRFVAVGLDPPEDTKLYATEHQLPFEIVTPVDRAAFQEAYGISRVPQTLVVGRDGRVKDVQPGVLSKRFFHRLG